MKPIKKLTVSALFIAMFVAIVGSTASISFGAIQVRVANSLYALSYLFPFLVLPTGLAVVTSNLLFGGLGLLDVIGGFIVPVLSTSCMVLIRKFNLPKILVVLPTFLIPTFGVPLWLSPILGIPYWALIPSMAIGNFIPAVLGYILILVLEKKTKYL